MRASFMLLGPLLSRFGEVVISNPGGDRIGRRPVDLHVDAMRAMGATIDYRYGYYYAKAPGRLRGTEIRFPIVSVMGTENAMLAATLADGHTVIRPAAQEPEIDDLIAFLQKMGAEVERTYPDTIEIEGKRRLRGAEHKVMPDRIEAGTFAIAAGVTGGHVVLEGADCDTMDALVEVLGSAGLAVSCAARPDGGRRARRSGRGGMKPVDIETGPYPELATDIQPPTTVLLTQATGDSQRPRGDLRGPPGVDRRARQDGRQDRAQGPAAGRRPRPVEAARRRRRDLRPARRRLADPRRAGGGRHLVDRRRAPRPARV